MTTEAQKQGDDNGTIAVEPDTRIHLVCRRNGDGVMVEFAADPTGKCWHVDALPASFPHPLVCPACNQQVDPVRGKVVAHHFRHRSRTACEQAGETMAHRLAKQFIEEALFLQIPPVMVEGLLGRETLHQAQRLKLDHVTLEKKLGNIVPDILAHVGERQILIEIHVTHAIDDRKRRKIEGRNLAVLEIDLSAFSHSVSVEQLRNAVLTTAPRRWIHNPKGKERSGLKKERDREQLEALSTRFTQPQPHRHGGMKARIDAIRKELNHLGLSHLLHPDPALDGAFMGEGGGWRAILLENILQLKTATTRTAPSATGDDERRIDISTALKELRRRGFVKDPFGRPLDNEIEVAFGLKLPLNSAWRAIETWFQTLRNAEILDHPSHGTRISTILHHASDLRAAVRRLEDALTTFVMAHRYATSASPVFRSPNLLERFGEISQEQWLGIARAMSVRDSEIDYLIRGIEAAENACRPPYHPLDSQIPERIGIELATMALAKLREENLEAERQARGVQIAATAKANLGEDADEFLDAQNRDRRIGSLRAQAMRSSHNLERVARLIDRERRAREAETTLTTLAIKTFGPDEAQVFLNRQNGPDETALIRVRRRAEDGDERAAWSMIEEEQQRRMRMAQETAERNRRREARRKKNLELLKNEFGSDNRERFDLFLGTQQPGLGHARPREICDTSEGYERCVRLARQMRKQHIEVARGI